jgi:hypothetical protein
MQRIRNIYQIINQNRIIRSNRLVWMNNFWFCSLNTSIEWLLLMSLIEALLNELWFCSTIVIVIENLFILLTNLNDRAINLYSINSYFCALDSDTMIEVKLNIVVYKLLTGISLQLSQILQLFKKKVIWLQVSNNYYSILSIIEILNVYFSSDAMLGVNRRLFLFNDYWKLVFR